MQKFALLAGGALGTLASSEIYQRVSVPESLGTALSEASGALVSEGAVRAEPSRGIVSDMLFGRQVLFLAQTEKGGARDVFRASVYLWPDGRLVRVSSVHNLTRTPIGDDHSLVVHGSRAAFATSAYGREQSVTLLDTEGEGAENTAERPLERLQAWITNLQQTGSGAGIGRIDVPFERPLRAVGLAFTDGTLRVDLAETETAVRTVEIDLAKGELVSPVADVTTQAATHHPKRFSHWAVDTVRAVPWIGPKPITWLEETVFAVNDSAKRLMSQGGAASELRVEAPEGDEAPRVTPPAGPFADPVVWPPANIPSIWKTADPAEGVWQSAVKSWTKRPPSADDSAPPLFYRTFVRPDEQRPDSKVILLAMDTRQVELDMEAGAEDPEPLTGPHGTGRLPRDPAIYTRVVAAFNGAFKTEHGHYGMMVHGRVLLPAIPGAATVVVTKDHRVGMGSWGANPAEPEIAGLSDDAVVSFRQNLDPLLDRGQINPSGRNMWGYTLPGTTMQTERTGICVTSGGQLLYAWGDYASGTTIAKAMKMAGCDYGMHLDMNPHHTGLIFTNIDELPGKFKSELLSPGMEIPTDRFIQYAPKDFFYVMVRGAPPKAIPGAPPFQVDGGKQPPPSWLGAIWKTQVSVGGAEVEVIDVERDRVQFRVRAGAKELPGASLARDLSSAEALQVAMAVGIGTATQKRPLGLTTAGRQGAVDLAGEGLGVVLLDGSGGVTIGKGGRAQEVPPNADSVELPLLAFDGEVYEASSVPSFAHAALGTAQDGRILLARGGATPAQLSLALTRAGATRVVLLDRGAGATSTYYRAGMNLPLPSAAESVLYALAVPMKPRAFRFDARTVAPPATAWK